MRVDVEGPAESADDPDEDEHVDLEDVEGEGHAERKFNRLFGLWENFGHIFEQFFNR